MNKVISREYVEENYIHKDKIKLLFDITINHFIDENIDEKGIMVKILKKLKQSILEE